VKYSPEGGRVEVALNISQNDTREVTLSVTDQGPGIPPEDMAHLFERFYRADKSRARVKSSAGLGLSIAKLIVDQHNGRLWVESDVGKGSTFIMTLPVQSNGYAKSR
jgi:signal transduction histidine kinase